MSTGTGATEAAEALQDTLVEAHAALVAAVNAYSQLPRPWGLFDVIPAMQNAARLHLGALEIAEAAKAVASAAREGLQQAFDATGCPAVDIAGYRVSATDGHRLVRVFDTKRVPANMMIQPPREPDISTIRKLLFAGEEVPGCELTTSKPSVRFTRRST